MSSPCCYKLAPEACKEGSLALWMARRTANGRCKKQENIHAGDESERMQWLRRFDAPLSSRKHLIVLFSDRESLTPEKETT
jgi:hypothetical protein